MGAGGAEAGLADRRMWARCGGPARQWVSKLSTFLQGRSSVVGRVGGIGNEQGLGFAVAAHGLALSGLLGVPNPNALLAAATDSTGSATARASSAGPQVQGRSHVDANSHGTRGIACSNERLQ